MTRTSIQRERRYQIPQPQPLDWTNKTTGLHIGRRGGYQFSIVERSDGSYLLQHEGTTICTAASLEKAKHSAEAAFGAMVAALFPQRSS